MADLFSIWLANNDGNRQMIKSNANNGQCTEGSHATPINASALKEPPSPVKTWKDFTPAEQKEMKRLYEKPAIKKTIHYSENE